MEDQAAVLGTTILIAACVAIFATAVAIHFAAPKIRATRWHWWIAVILILGCSIGIFLLNDDPRAALIYAGVIVIMLGMMIHKFIRSRRIRPTSFVAPPSRPHWS